MGSAGYNDISYCSRSTEFSKRCGALESHARRVTHRNSGPFCGDRSRSGNVPLSESDDDESPAAAMRRNYSSMAAPKRSQVAMVLG